MELVVFILGVDDYLSPSIASNYPYPRYENEDAVPPPFEKSVGVTDNLHSPLRYTSSPTLQHAPSDGDKLSKLLVDISTSWYQY